MSAEPLTAYEKATLIAKEKEDMRKEIIDMKNGLVKMVVLFVTIFGTAISIGSSKEIIGNTQIRELITFILSQVQFFIALVVLCFLADISLHASYVRSLETKLNLLSKDNIAIWESELSKNYVLRPRGVYFWLIAIIIVLLFVLYGVLINLSLKTIEVFLPKYTLYFEVIIALAAVIWLLFEPDRLERHATKILQMKIKSK